MLVKEIMTKKVITVKPSDNLKTVLTKFSKYKISGMPVVDKNNNLKGIVSEGDVMRSVETCLPKMRFDNSSSFDLILQLVKTPNIETLKKGKHCNKIKVKEFMKKRVITIKPEDKVLKAAEVMSQKNVKRLAVVKGNKLVGIIARADIIKALVK